MIQNYLNEIPKKIRERGANLYYDGAVTNTNYDRKYGLAEFHVTSDDSFEEKYYRVQFTNLLSSRMIATCSCPFYYDNLEERKGKAVSSKKITESVVKESSWDFSVDNVSKIIREHLVVKGWTPSYYNQSELTDKLSMSDRYAIGTLVPTLSLRSASPQRIELGMYSDRMFGLSITNFDSRKGTITCDCDKPQKPCVHMVAALIRLYQEGHFSILASATIDEDAHKSTFLRQNRLPDNLKYRSMLSVNVDLKGMANITTADSLLNNIIYLRSHLSDIQLVKSQSIELDEEETEYGLQYFLAVNTSGKLRYSITARVGKLKKNGEISKNAIILNEMNLSDNFRKIKTDSSEIKNALEVQNPMILPIAGTSG